MQFEELFRQVTSWADFCSRVSALSELERGTAFEHVVRHYLRIDPKYRTKLADVWFHHEVPAEIRMRLNFPPRDEGIDLLARTNTGEFWGIQAKYRSDADATLTHRELATFTSLAFAVCREISFALVCTTTARIPGILEDLPKLGDLTAETWSELGRDFFLSLTESFTAFVPPSLPTPRIPQKHQHAAVAAALAHYRDRAEARGKLISPCGSGKSLTAYWIGRELAVRRVLIAVPSLALVRQTLETWMREALADGRPVDWLCVCSDAEVTRVEAAETVAHVHELGIPCDTAPDALAAHLVTLNAFSGLQVVLTTYQSSPILAAAARTAGFAFDFAVLDEAHKTTGKAAGVFAHLLDDANLPLPRRLFMTATERRFAGTSDAIVSMDDSALYGETFSLLTFKAAIAAEPAILCDYRILTIGVRQSDVAALVAANRWLDLGPVGPDEVTALALASLIALRRATAVHGVRHTVSFHSSIARARDFQTLCNRLNADLTTEPPIPAHHVSGKLGSAARQREIKQFLAAAPSLITNARCLTEGVDIPSIDCVFFADPKGSTIEIVQAAGRALRLDTKSGKERGYILLPLVVPDGATLDEVTETSAFKFVLFVLRALAAHDERIIEWFRATAEGRTPEVGGLIDFDFANVVAPLGVNADEFASKIEVKCWETMAKLDYRTFVEAREWARLSGITKQPEWIRQWRAGKIPRDIPFTPPSVYERKGWIDWGDFLGHRRPTTRKQLRSHDEARAFAATLGLRDGTEWRIYARKGMEGKPPLPPDIPRNPMHGYRGKGWINWPHWVGREKGDYGEFALMDFDKAREFARSLKLSGQRAWRQYCTGKFPHLPPRLPGVPAGPEHYYQELGWEGYADWLGSDYIPASRRNYLPFAKARELALKLGIKSRSEWFAYVKSKKTAVASNAVRLPLSPERSYAKSGWISWSDWLGCEIDETKRVHKKSGRFREFKSAREFAHSLNLQGSLEWPRYLRGDFPDKPVLPADIPRNPRNVYSIEWRGWGDWLGTGNLAPFQRSFLPFGEARAFARQLELKSGAAWVEWCRVRGNPPSDIPRNPAAVYKTQGWISWRDFLQPPA
jgi:superfamily II DNA or RNA helicase